MEQLDIFDENYNYIGTSSKKDVHQKGLWHQTFDCLFIDSKKNTVYFQYKNQEHNAASSKNKIDISVGGHLLANEKISDGIREIKEEANLDVNYNNLYYLGIRKVNKVINENYIIREFIHLHIYDNSFDIYSLKSIDDEVLYYIEFNIDELIDFLNNNTSIIKGNTPYGEKSFNIDNFIEGYLEDDKLYLNYLLLAKRIINKEENVKWN